MSTDRSPYRDIACFYDELVGNTAFECCRENFERLARRYGIEFRKAMDAACGTGLMVDYLSGICEKVYAVDGSKWMLEQARYNVKRENVVFLEQDFSEIALPEQVDLITCNFDSLNYILEENLLREVLRGFSHALTPGGHLFFDMNGPGELKGWESEVPVVHRLQGGFSVWELQSDDDTRITTIRIRNFVEVEGLEPGYSEEIHKERYYEPDVVISMLKDSSFKCAEASDARDLGAIDENTRRYQFLARKI